MFGFSVNFVVDGHNLQRLSRVFSSGYALLLRLMQSVPRASNPSRSFLRVSVFLGSVTSHFLFCTCVLCFVLLSNSMVDGCNFQPVSLLFHHVNTVLLRMKQNVARAIKMNRLFFTVFHVARFRP
jgi:hypothetical protein